ncbi:YggS family pyridoxal phosphate-dependent enzyme [Candidatus Gracilibacteria bacterium]|nr:YggS family pyridoxal phosphate-dependent enzyme [Candidatus Gracilibacteria bacterium]MCF7856539.1 YggS family pyridoxal phosphate-dependent enzyme [Candidatus Gracilibacteria bacterium]MCF7896862.1 YggS family pyridoxal phosphate-dependent enzyme [Candidatus Gracilibacteria bacterium]
MRNLANNLAKFKNELTAVCQNCGRDPSKISIVAVTKNHSAAEINELLENGVSQIGENKLQEFLAKKYEIKNCEKHFIGRIQSNKAREIARNFDVVQSVGSVRIARILDDESAKLEKILPIFLQANLADESQKSGLLESELSQAVTEITKLQNLKIEGLMVIGVLGDDEKTREVFAEAKKLNDQFGFQSLSMGMSGDWQIAVEEGANFLRIGSLLFE